MLKILNTEKTAASFKGASFVLAGPEDWASIGDVPTRDAVLAWLAEGNVPEAFPTPTTTQLKVAELAELATAYVAAVRETHIGWLGAIVNDGASEITKKAALNEDLADLKAQYAIDRAAIISKYAAVAV